MSTAARIDELRKKFEENPRRYFAPLANEYRKAGDLVQAIALCREHLPKQPGHMSGYIVFGQALYEAGELGEARLVFEQALALDPENLIALRHLGDIAQASGDAHGARRWYERVLDADPRNNDIAAQLASLATGMTPVSSPAVASSVSPFARPMDTPPLPMSPIGLGMMPTPDSVMRAVDMDAFNVRVSHRTPIDLDAFDASRHGQAAESDSPSAESATDNLDDTDPFGFPVSLRSSSQHEASAASPVNDETMYTVDLGETATADSFDNVAAASDSADAETADADAAFEEGLIAPEWTDSADLVAQVATPRSFTPRSETPVINEAMPDTAAAFGRETHDAPESVALDATLDDEASLIPLRALTPAIPMVSLPTPAMGMLSTDQEPLDLAAMDLASMDLSSFTKPPAADTLEGVTRSEAVNDPDAFDVAYVAEIMDVADGAATDVPSLEGLDDLQSPVSADEQFIEMDVPEELPWLAMSDATPADSASVMDTDHEPGLQEIAEAIAEDARAAGDEHAITVSAVDEPTWSEHAGSDVAAFSDVASFNEESFADDELSDDFAGDKPFEIESLALDSSDVNSLEVNSSDNDSRATDSSDVESAEADVARSQPTPATGSTAFVTETMAELLISQGFHSRAADVYEELVRRHPFDVVLTSRLAEVRAMMAPAAGDAVESTVDNSATHGAAVDAAAANETHDDTSDVLFNTSESAAADINSMPTPAYGTPAFGTPIYTAAITSQPTPDFNSVITDDASWATPVRTTPYAQPAVVDEPAMPSRTAREWFAAIAARRVPRRTPPQSSPALVESPSEGLASLFGTDASAHDDAAARALADAFAPVTSEDLAAGVALDFEFARSTPAFSPVVAASMTPMSTPSLPSNVNPVQLGSPDDRSGSGGNAGFSFDKFFPDPATRRSTPAAGSGDTPSAPVTDDLAQFSAWLKGLGNT